MEPSQAGTPTAESVALQRAALRADLAALGRILSPEFFVATTTRLAALALSPAGCSVQRDVAYGEDARHRLDLFVPSVLAGPAPVLVYVHGGGFVRGDKGTADAPFYNNFGAWAASRGFIGVTMTYRLAPDAPWPAGSADVGRAVAWLRANAARLGGDDGSIFVVGQSAGAAHVAGYVADDTYHDRPAPIAGAVMLSGLYDLERLARSPFEDAYYGTDIARLADMSPLNGLVASPIPCLFGVSQHDPLSFQSQALLLTQAWFEAHREWPAMLWLAGHNHLSPAMLIGSAHDTIGPEIEQFVLAKRGGAAGGC